MQMVLVYKAVHMCTFPVRTCLNTLWDPRHCIRNLDGQKQRITLLHLQASKTLICTFDNELNKQYLVAFVIRFRFVSLIEPKIQDSLRDSQKEPMKIVHHDTLDKVKVGM